MKNKALIFLIFFLSAGILSADNVALGKKATIAPSSNYSLCTDSEDAAQLTDGKTSEGRIWTQKSTVGWTSVNPNIVIDLGRVEPIESVTIHSVGGGVAGVYFPKKITVYVSDDNITFYEVAQMTSAGLQQDAVESYTHFFSAAGLKTRGRYVMVCLQQAGYFLFVDEIEVNRGDFDPASVVFSGRAVSGAEIQFDALGLIPESYTRGHFPETPHVAWAIPLAGRPLRAILVNNYNTMREMVEVAQRLGMDYTPVPFLDPLPYLSEELITANLADCDVLVAGAINWKALPPELLEKILTRVREGMGLVCVTNDNGSWIEPIQSLLNENPLPDDQHLLDLVPMTLIPGYHAPPGDAHFTLATYGKGRVALLNSAKFTRPASFLMPAFTHEDYIEKTNGPLEYWFAAFNKLVLWTANRDKQLISKIEATPEKIAVEITPGHVGKLRVITRDPFFNPVATREEAVSLSGGRFEFQPPTGLQGIHAVDAWLLDDKGAVLDFGSSFYQRQGENRLTAIQVEKTLFAAGEPVTAMVEVQKPAEGLVLRASLFDTDGREVSAPQTLPIGADGKVAVSLPYTHPLTLGATLNIELLRDEKALEIQRRRVWVEVPDSHDFTVMGWGTSAGVQPVAAALLATLRNLGVDGIVVTYVRANINNAPNAALANLRLAPENVARVAPPNPPDKNGIRVPSLSDPAHQKQVEEILQALTRDTRPFGVTEWSLGDEESLGGQGEEYDFSPDSLAKFREWLKGQYADLRELNESWGSSYKDWAEVTPSMLKQVKPKESLAPWLDFRRFMETVFADYHASADQIIKAENPAARVGFSGSQNQDSYNGYDWWKLMKAVDHVSGYVGVQSALQRSFLRPGAFWTTFIGYDYNDTGEQQAHAQPWKVLFNGANGVNYFGLMHLWQICGLLRNDFSPTKKAGWFFPEIRELKAGTGRLFMEAAYEDDGIGILYSPSSAHAATVSGLADTANTRRNFGINQTNLAKLLSESHYQYRFVHEEQLERGELSRFKVLFLPWSSALSDAEATAIRQFVKDGGTVIADSFAGVRDGHGKPHAMLEDVFGIVQPLKAPSLVEGALEVTDAGFSGPKKVFITTGVTGLELKGGEARGSVRGAPAFIVHSYGKGRAIFLNANLSNYSKQTSGGEGGEIERGDDAAQSVSAPIRAFMTALLTEAGVPVPLPVRSGEVENSEIELSRFRLGDARLLGVLRAIRGEALDPDNREDVTLALGRPWHAYDIRAGKYLGETDIIRESLPRATAKAYALLPYKVNAVTVSGRGQFARGETAVFPITVVADGQPGKHVVRLTVAGPDGKERPLYARNLVAPGGKTEAVIPLAWNDQEGEWTITAKDVATGVVGRKTIQLKN